MSATPRRMLIGQRRVLTAGEIALAREMFGAAIAYERIGIWQSVPFGFGAMVPFGRAVIFARWRAPFDFIEAPLEEQGWFIHEIAHVWQAARGVILPLAKLRALGAGAYRLRLQPGRPLGAYNIEAQAEIARLVWCARRGCAPENAELATLWARG